jgi:hypothetical protein
MRCKAAIFALILALATTGTVAAAEIYKWVDEDGTIHYGDRPTGDVDEQRIAIASRPTDPDRVKQEVQARLDREQRMAELETQQPQGPSEEDLRAEAEERNQKCNMFRQRMESFTNSRHLYREDSDGERVYLDESEMQDARDKVQGQVNEYCNS